MEVKKINATSFEITIEDKDGKHTTSYEIPGDITNWQLQQIEMYISDLLRDCNVAGKVIVNSLLALINNQSNKDELSSMKVFAKMLNAFEGEQGGYFGAALTGISDILKFFGTNGMVRIASVLFLKKGETSVRQKDILSAREDLFLDIPASYLYEGIVNFFGEKVRSVMSTLSRLQTSAPEKNEQPILESDQSLPQDSTIDLPSLSQTESLNE